MAILLVDNYDSFTYNIYHYLLHLGESVAVKRNDSVSIAEILFDIKPRAIIISPGPCTPSASGASLEIIKHHIKIQVPILGICLGHQVIAQHFGCEVICSNKPMHGKVTVIKHYNHKIFANIPNKFQVARYHSLVVNKNNFANSLTITAVDEENTIMGIAHRKYPIYGLQFHPESIGSEYGYQIFQNFLNIIKSTEEKH